MVVIRLSRIGRKKYPQYRIVAADKRRAVSSKFIAILGHYNPHTKELVIKKEEVLDWMDKGAQPSNTVLKLLKKEDIKLPKWASIKTFKKAPKAKEKEQEAVKEAETKQASKPAEPAEQEKETEEPKVAEVASKQAEADEKKEAELKTEAETPAELENVEETKEKTEKIADKITKPEEKTQEASQK
ncbi:MAG: 30S ribosomal protein S16 [bacterium]|nr:30S ribosomal protein S16 [bacterium]